MSIISEVVNIFDDTDKLLLESAITNIDSVSDVYVQDEISAHDNLSDSTLDGSMEVNTSFFGRLLAALHQLLAFLSFQRCRQSQQINKEA